MNQGVYEEVLYLDTNGGDYSCCTFGGNLTVVDHAMVQILDENTLFSILNIIFLRFCFFKCVEYLREK